MTIATMRVLFTIANSACRGVTGGHRVGSAAGVDRVKNEFGYSLIEVLVAIVIIAVAIIPMIGMFDAALRAAVLGGNYDTGRALANQELESVKALSYSEVQASYPPGQTKPCSNDRAEYTCTITTAYVDDNLQNVSGPTSAVRVDVLVDWDAGAKTYTATGLIARGSP